MRSEKGTSGQKTGRTFIETARRAQIVAAAIDTIAELGYGQASLARIAETAGTSKGVIIYHFGSKDDLIRELVAELSAKGRAYMGPRLEAEPTGAGMLRAYIEVQPVVHPREPQPRARGGRDRLSTPAAPTAARCTTLHPRGGVAALRQLLAHFQGTGEFRADFDPDIMAMAIRAALDAMPSRLARDPDLDIGRYGRELADLFQAAIRPGESHPGTASHP